MILTTRHEKVSTIVERWMRQYPDSKKDITQKLIELNPKTVQGINDIIGNDSWTRNCCYECNADVDVLVAAGDDEDTVYLCISCLNRAVSMINSIYTV